MSSAPPPFVGDPAARPRSDRLAALAVRAGLVLLAVLLLGRCTLGFVDRPAFLGLATTTRGASLAGASRVVIVLHGYGADKDDLRRITPEVDALGAPERTAYVYAEGPFSTGAGRAWWVTNDPAERAESVRRVSKLVDEVLAKTELPPNRVYLAGFSQGAMLALEVALERRDALGGVVALSPCRQDIPWAALGAMHSAPLAGAIAHGKDDRVCRFGDGQQIAQDLGMRFVPFDGHHRVTTEGEAALAALLRGDP